jgi:hypothetical protein
MTDKWGIPDWRDAAAYPDSLNDQQWRWQFLRRRKDYRKDWKANLPASVAWYREHKTEEFIKGTPLGDGRCFGENFGNGPESQHFRVHMKGSMKKYALDGLRNPALAFCDVSFKQTKPVTITFDLSEPIEQQVENCRHILTALKARYAAGRQQRKRRTEWRKYLRALDAHAQGAKNREIWQILSNGSRAENPHARGSDLVKAAEKLRDNFTT